MDPTVPTSGPPGETQPQPIAPLPPEAAPPAPPPAPPPAAPKPPPAPAAPSSVVDPVVVTKPSLASRLEMVGALVTAVVGIEFLALLVGMSGGGVYRNAGDRVQALSLNLDARMAVRLLIAGMLVTLPEIVDVARRPPRTSMGRTTLIVIAVLGTLIAVLALIGIGLDLSRDTGVFGNQAGAVLHRLAIVLMAATAAGWSLAALGVRVVTTKR